MELIQKLKVANDQGVSCNMVRHTGRKLTWLILPPHATFKLQISYFHNITFFSNFNTKQKFKHLPFPFK